MNTTTQNNKVNGLASRVLEIFAEVTRYPAEILDTQASLEEDLGIDSVKLGEVFSVLRERYHLPEKLDLPREQLKTISGVTEALSRFLDRNGSAPASPAVKQESVTQTAHVPPNSVDSSRSRNGPPGDLDSQVLGVFAEVTRYPSEILDPHANLEEDLGVDSVKLGEVFSVLRERFRLPEKLDVPREQLKTITGVTNALRQYLSSDQSATKNGEGNAFEGSALASGAARPVAPAHTVQAVPADDPNRSSETAGRGGLDDEVLQAFARVTRYPVEMLDPAARLEEDLGIDSAKVREVLLLLSEQYRLPAIDWQNESLKTIRGIAEALRDYLSRRSAVDNPRPEATLERNVVQHSGNRAAEKTAEQSFASLQPALKPFEGKIAFISGSGRGIGKDIAVYLANLGATVIVNSFHSRPRGEQTAAAIKAAGGEAIHLWGSMANPSHVDEIFNQIEARFGAIDFFISSASNGMLARLKDITVEDWEKAFRTNIIGLHQGAMRSAKLMKKRGGGKIITMSSPAAHGYVDYFGCMGAVKAAVESLTRSLAIELAPDNIQVNCVSPGPVYGELLNKWPENERLIKQWEGNTAYERLCKPEDVSHFVAYLLSDAVKLFTGSVLVMDGGISAQGW